MLTKISIFSGWKITNFAERWCCFEGLWGKKDHFRRKWLTQEAIASFECKKGSSSVGPK